MSISVAAYLEALMLFICSGGLGMAYGQYRLAIKEMFDAAGA